MSDAGITSAMIDQRLAFGRRLDSLDATHHDDVVTSVVERVDHAVAGGDAALYDRRASDPGGMRDAGPVVEPPRETDGVLLLVGREDVDGEERSEEHTSELQSIMR